MKKNDINKTTLGFKFRLLIIVWIVTLASVAVLYTVSFTTKAIVKAETFWLLNIFLTFASFVVTSFFSYMLVKQSDLVNTRSESFRTLQFVASNYAAVDFVDYMIMYEVYGRYINELKKTRNFQFYLREDDVTFDEIMHDFNNFFFVTIRIPIQPLSTSSQVAAIRFSDFKFHKEDSHHYFVPCTESTRNALILYNKDDRRQEVVVNLVVRKSSEFWTKDAVNPFLKITFSHTMYSLLGVSISGWTELYFVNPQKLEKDGANKYTINSSQFEVSGMPKLSPKVESDIIGLTKDF